MADRRRQDNTNERAAKSLMVCASLLFAASLLITSLFPSRPAYAQSKAPSSAASENAVSRQDEISLIESGDEQMKMFLGQRLIDPPHWKQGTAKGIWPKYDAWVVPEPTVNDPDRKPYDGYGPGAFRRWTDGSLYVLKNSTHFPSIADYQKVHALTFHNEPGDMFWGYYKQQIWEKFPWERQEELNELLKKSETSAEDLKKLLAMGIQNGRGVLRTTGDSSWSGKPWSEEKNLPELYSPAEFNRLARQPFLRTTLVKQHPDGIEASFQHPKGEDVVPLLEKLFQETESSAQYLKKHKVELGAEYRPMALRLTARFYIHLLLIHGYWDGVGRSSKQMRDWMLRYLDLQVPADTPIDDMEYSPVEYARTLDQAIRRTEDNLKKLNTRARGARAMTCPALFK